jgi:hypothetical protein
MQSAIYATCKLSIICVFFFFQQLTAKTLKTPAQI